MKNEAISAFAYMTAQQIEYIVNQETGNLRDINDTLTARILAFRSRFILEGDSRSMELLDQYDKFFGINTQNADNFSNEEEGS